MGSREDRKKYEEEWHTLRMKGDKVDDFLDKVTNLMWILTPDDGTIKAKLRMGISDELYRDWEKIYNKPAPVTEQIKMLREMGHVIELINKGRNYGNSGEREPRKSTQ